MATKGLTPQGLLCFELLLYFKFQNWVQRSASICGFAHPSVFISADHNHGGNGCYAERATQCGCHLHTCTHTFRNVLELCCVRRNVIRQSKIKIRMQEVLL